ncbi:hypothetical protein FRC03_006466 [Tulasnella sp. 419]|nr:hypothetical protein FRC02_004558 [Tulasnella sp. 418]KAG8960509.1 hypothetical protein FRC03_006466 [Tulasnella sp. 419]
MSDSLVHAVAGGAGGVVAMTLTYPLIFLSTRSAVETKKSNKKAYEAIIDVIKKEGMLGMYSGLTSSLLGIAVTNFVYYGFYEKSREVILRSRPGKGLSTPESMLAGLLAGSATSVISNPLWVVQTTQAVHTASSDDSKSSQLGFIQSIKHILKTGGLAAFWRGIGPALILVINPIIQYTVFEQLKNILLKKRTAKLRAAGSAAAAIITGVDYFYLGALSKLVATATTYPYIVVKARMQSGHPEALKYKSALNGILTILKNEGLAGLYKGIESKLIQSVLTAAILFVGQKRIYEITKSAMATTSLTPLKSQ